MFLYICFPAQSCLLFQEFHTAYRLSLQPRLSRCDRGSPHLAPVVQKVDSAIQRINLYPVVSVIVFPNTYPLDIDLSGGKRYPVFEQLGRDVWRVTLVGSIVQFIRLPVRATLNQEMSRAYVKKRQNGGRSSQKALRVLSPLQCDRFSQRRDGSFLVFWQRVGTNTNLLRGVIGPISTRYDYLNTVFNDVVNLRGSCRNKQPSHGPHGKSFNLLQVKG